MEDMVDRIELTVGKCSLRNPCIIATRYHDDTWTKNVIEIAEYKTVEEAETVIAAIMNLLKLSKPEKILIRG